MLHNDNNLVIAHVVGDMLKIIKNDKQDDKYIKEFASIRHGNYDMFIELINVGVTPMVSYDDGIITVNPKSVKGMCDFGKLIGASDALIKFHKEIYHIYSKINDNDFSDEIYRKLAMFEIKIRMHANNKNLISDGDTLNDIIDKLSISLLLTKDEVEKLHNGRLFLNKIKHHKKNNNAWKQNISLFNEAYSILAKYEIVTL